MKVLVADKISPVAVETMRKAGLEVEEKTGLSEEELAKKVSGFDGMIVRSGAQVTKKVISGGNKLKLISRAGVGVDNIDLEAAKQAGVCVPHSSPSTAL